MPKINISVRTSVPEGFEVVKEYQSFSVMGNDVASAIDALRAKVENDCTEANWILGIGFSEIQGKSCVATGFPYALKSK